MSIFCHYSAPGLSLSRHYSILRGKKEGCPNPRPNTPFSPISSPLSAFVYPLRISIHAPFRAFLALWEVSIQPARCRPPIPSPRIQPKSKQNVLNVWPSFSHIPVSQCFPFSSLYLMFCGAFIDRESCLLLGPPQSELVPQSPLFRSQRRS